MSFLSVFQMIMWAEWYKTYAFTRSTCNPHIQIDHHHLHFASSSQNGKCSLADQQCQHYSSHYCKCRSPHIVEMPYLHFCLILYQTPFFFSQST
jgi:hypothetical protein